MLKVGLVEGGHVRAQCIMVMVPLELMQQQWHPLDQTWVSNKFPSSIIVDTVHIKFLKSDIAIRYISKYNSAYKLLTTLSYHYHLVKNVLQM